MISVNTQKSLSFFPCRHVKINSYFKMLLSYWSTFKFGTIFFLLTQREKETFKLFFAWYNLEIHTYVSMYRPKKLKSNGQKYCQLISAN